MRNCAPITVYSPLFCTVKQKISQQKVAIMTKSKLVYDTDSYQSQSKLVKGMQNSVTAQKHALMYSHVIKIYTVCTSLYV